MHDTHRTIDVMVQHRKGGLYVVRPNSILHDLPMSFEVHEYSTDYLSEHIPLGNTAMLRVSTNRIARLVLENHEASTGPEAFAFLSEYDVAQLFQELAKAEGRWIELDPLAPAPF